MKCNRKSESVAGRTGNDPVETVIISSNTIDTVYTPANKRNACCTGIEIADAINGAVCTSNRIRKVATGYGVYFGGGIAPSSHGVIASNAIEQANGYGVWVNARGKAPSAQFPNASAGPTGVHNPHLTHLILTYLRYCNPDLILT